MARVIEGYSDTKFLKREAIAEVRSGNYGQIDPIGIMVHRLADKKGQYLKAEWMDLNDLGGLVGWVFAGQIPFCERAAVDGFRVFAMADMVFVKPGVLVFYIEKNTYLADAMTGPNQMRLHPINPRDGTSVADVYYIIDFDEAQIRLDTSNKDHDLVVVQTGTLSALVQRSMQAYTIYLAEQVKELDWTKPQQPEYMVMADAGMFDNQYLQSIQIVRKDPPLRRHVMKETPILQFGRDVSPDDLVEPVRTDYEEIWYEGIATFRIDNFDMAAGNGMNETIRRFFMHQFKGHEVEMLQMVERAQFQYSIYNLPKELVELAMGERIGFELRNLIVNNNRSANR